jgi:hypothetical protein
MLYIIFLFFQIDVPLKIIIEFEICNDLPQRHNIVIF